MRHNNYKLKITTRPSVKRWLLTASIGLIATSISGAAIAATDDTNTDYVDSVHSWGAWALDIEPAAGGIQAQASQPLYARATKVALRTNSIAALAPPRPLTPRSDIIVIPNTPTPVPTPLPTPAIPTITAVSSSVPIPIGGPGIPSGAP